MSDVPTGPPNATPGAQPGEQPSEEEIRAYLGQLREAPVDQVIAEVVSALLNAAQVKLGRRDARVLLDTMGAVSDTIRGVLPGELTSQVDQALTQLRLAQVEAEQQVGAAAAEGHRETSDLDDAARAPADAQGAPGTPAPARGPAAPAQQQAPSDAASRLWIPGR